MRKRSSDASICSQHRGDRVALQGGELVDVVALVAVLGRLLPAPHRLDRGAEPVHLRAGVVVVVLALDLVAGELEQARDASRRTRRCGREATVIGPVGFAETISTWTRCPVALRRRRTRPRRRGSRRAPTTNHSSRRKRLTKPGPATSARSTPSRPAAAAAISAASSRGGLSPRSREPQRDVRRVVAVLRLARPLELELRADRVGERGGERPDGISRQRVSRGRRDPRAARISSGEPTPISTSPTSIGVSGSGVVSKRAVALAQRDDERARLVPDAQVADRPPGRRARLADLDLGELQVGARRRSSRCRGTPSPAA